MGPKQAVRRFVAPQTAENPRGLTARELEVLRLLAEGPRNTENAEGWSSPPKTVDHPRLGGAAQARRAHPRRGGHRGRLARLTGRKFDPKAHQPRSQLTWDEPMAGRRLSV